MPQLAAEPVQLPNQKHIPTPEAFEAGPQPGPALPPVVDLVLIQPVGTHAGGEQGSALDLARLAAVRPVMTHVAGQHGSCFLCGSECRVPALPLLASRLARVGVY